jgi:hypothetical protein
MHAGHPIIKRRKGMDNLDGEVILRSLSGMCDPVPPLDRRIHAGLVILVPVSSASILNSNS